METLLFRFENGTRKLARQSALIGVVGSGNLEVLIETVDLNGACCITSRPRERLRSDLGSGRRRFSGTLATCRYAHLGQ